VHKKTKQEEKDDIIDKTKLSTLDKYGVSDPFSLMLIHRYYCLEEDNRQKVYADNCCAQWH
jgi:hypothetical protein